MLHAQLCLAMAMLASNAVPKERIALACSMAPAIVENSQRTGADPYLISALIWTESRWNPAAKNGNSCGVAQINPGRTRGTCEQLKDPAYAIAVAARLLGRKGYWQSITRKYCRVHGCNNMAALLAAYNTGHPKGLDTASGRHYADKVLAAYKKLKAAATKSK